MVVADKLSFEHLLIDSHCDTVLNTVNSGGAYRFGQLNSTGHVDIPRLRRGGVGVQFFATYVGHEYKPDRAVKRTLYLLDTLHREIDDNCQDLRLILHSRDIEKAQANGQIGALIAIEGGEALEGDLAALRMYHRLGVRSLGLTWNERNQIAEGVGQCRSGGKLTDFGVSVVQEMNRLGMIIDLSHISEAGFFDCLEQSSQPVIASHSNVRALCEHPRNLSDSQIKALAAHGGVMGITFVQDFLVSTGRASISDVVRHIEHVLHLLGDSRHIGIGGDLDGTEHTPSDLYDATCYPRLIDVMLQRGIDENAVKNILGLNYRRVIGAVLG